MIITHSTRTLVQLHLTVTANQQRGTHPSPDSPAVQPWWNGSCALMLWWSWQKGSWGRTPRVCSPGQRWWASWLEDPSLPEDSRLEGRGVCCIRSPQARLQKQHAKKKKKRKKNKMENSSVESNTDKSHTGQSEPQTNQPIQNYWEVSKHGHKVPNMLNIPEGDCPKGTGLPWVCSFFPTATPNRACTNENTTSTSGCLPFVAALTVEGSETLGPPSIPRGRHSHRMAGLQLVYPRCEALLLSDTKELNIVWHGKP